MPAEAFSAVIKSYLQVSHNHTRIQLLIRHLSRPLHRDSRYRKTLLSAGFTLITNLDLLTDSQQLESGDSLLIRMLDCFSG